MRTPLALLLGLLLLHATTSCQSFNQQSVASAEAVSQAHQIVQVAIAAITDGVKVNDLTASGTAVLGTSPNISAEVTLEVKETRQSKVTYTAGPLLAETRNDSQSHAGQWKDSSGRVHDTPLHNCLVPPSVLEPIMLLYSLLEDGSISYVGTDTLDGESVTHLRYSKTAKTRRTQFNAAFERLSTLDLYLDLTTTRVVQVFFNTHSEADAASDVPVRLRFSDYRPVQGVLVPFRVQRFIQNSLSMDLTLSNAQINSGISDSEFALQ